MSRKKPWFKFNDDAFFSATMGWPGDLKGFYALLILLLESRGGKLPDDMTMFYRATGYQGRRCKRLLNALQTLGKCSLNDGYWSFAGRLPVVQRVFEASKPLKTLEPASKTRSVDKEKERKRKSAGARVSLGHEAAPHDAAPSEQEKPEDKTPALSEEERAQFVRKILGREVLPGRLEQSPPVDISDFPDAPRK